MMMMRSIALFLLMACLWPATARADGYASPFVGANFGGSVGTPLGVAARDRNRATFGVALGAMGGGIVGVELDLAYTSNFYAQDDTDGAGSNLLTLVPTFILGIPIGGQQGVGIRPYVVAGAGLLRRDVKLGSLASFSQSDLAYSLGGGVMGFLTDRFGIRGDVRYYRNFQVDEIELPTVSVSKGTFGVGRASVGAVFRF